MSVALTLALQAASQAAAPTAPAAIDFDLARHRPAAPRGARGCAAEPGEIVVCGRRDRRGDYPIERWERAFRHRPVTAETRLVGDVAGRAFVESAQMPNGTVSSRLMIGIRVPF